MLNLSVSWGSDLYSILDESEYSDLVDRIPSATVFNSWSWVSTCYEYLAESETARILTVRNAESRLVACVPMVLLREKKFGVVSRVVRLMGYPFTDRYTLLVDTSTDDSVLNATLSALKAEFGKTWDRMEWNELALDEGLVKSISAWAKQNNSLEVLQVTSHCPVLPLSGLSRKEIEAQYTSKLRSDLKRRKKKLLEHGEVEILHYQPAEPEVDEILDQLKRVEDSSWKGAEGIGIFSNARAFDFFKTVSRKLAKFKQLDIAEIRIDGALVSYKYGFKYDRVFLDYNIAYLPEYHRLGLGRLLLNEVILSSSENNYKAVDASRVGAQSKHLLFERSEETIRHMRWTWYGGTWRAYYHYVLNFAVKPIAKKIKARYF